ncbi:LysE family translocator [Oricola sp.]|uniref:LysE family translocator n=1 Tax=Oricola sp. TaxID=1979950 RepID=UPI003BAAA18D
MSMNLWLVYVTTVFLMMCTPGPSQLLMLSNSIANGWRKSMATAAGDLTANLLQMLAAGLGLAAIIVASQHALSIIKWCGVAYLSWLGLRMILNAGKSSSTQGSRGMPVRRLWMQGFVTSAANPKAVVFFAALFPLFITPGEAFWPQFAVLSATYLVMDGMFLSAYGVSASWLASRLKGKARPWLDRAGGTFMIGAAILLGLKPVEK